MRKFISVLFALVLVLTFSLVTAAPAGASPGTLYVRPYTLAGTGTNTAAWSAVQKPATSSYSVLLTYVDGDNAYVEFTPLTGITVNDLASITSTQWSFWYYASAANGPLLELRFTSGDGHVDITVNTAESSPTTGSGTTEAVTTASTCIYFGNDATDQTSFYNNTGSVTLAGVLASINAQSAMTAGSEDAAAWALTRVRAEIGWGGSGRTCYIDDIEINNVTYNGKIQNAIDAASSGDTISVAAGTYEEDLIIGTALTLESTAGAATTIILSAGSPNDIVRITAADVTIDGFTIQGLSDTSGAVNGIDVRGSGFTIQNNIFAAIYYDNIFLGDTAVPITLGLIDSNTFTGMGTGAAAYRPAINVESNANAISGVTVSNNTISAYGGTESAGIQVAETTGAVSGITVSGNTIGTTTFGIATWNDGAATFTGNTITGCDVGVDIYGDVADLTPSFTLSGNTITTSTSYGIRVRTDANDLTGVGIVIKYNTITGNGDGVSVACTGTVNSYPVARYNYWGKATGPYNATTNPGVTGYRGDTVSAAVTYAPWLYYTTAANSGDSVANIVTNEVPAYANSVVLGTVGWNTFSVPIGLDGQYNTWAELYTLTSLDYSLAYRFDPATQAFVALATTSTYAIAPGEAFYVKMDSAGSIPYCYSTVVSIPSRSLSANWDLIGGGLTARTEIASCTSIATVGSTAGYTHIVMPTESANLRPFTLSTGTNAAAWSTVQKGTGTLSVLLNYVSGDNSYVEFTPATGTTVADLASITDGWSWWYYASAGYGPLLELRFTKAGYDSVTGYGHVDITVNTAEASPAITTGTTEEVTNASTCIYFGNDPTDGTSFYDNTGSVTLAGVLAAINAETEMTAGSDTAAAWELTRVRAEIGWSAPARTCYIDDIEINNVIYYGKAWVYIAGASTAGNFVAGEGYWVFLPIARTLGLFDPTPVSWVP